MPALLFFAPCEKALVDETTHTFSLISMLEEITVELVPNADLPSNPILPIQWAIASLWQQHSAYETGRTFQQRTTLSSDNEPSKVTIESIADFTFTATAPRQRIIARIVGMPIGAPGDYKVRLWIREKTETPKEWREAASFPLQIKFRPTASTLN
jgi:hypothetical protein